jgi:hypothetical protein
MRRRIATAPPVVRPCTVPASSGPRQVTRPAHRVPAAPTADTKTLNPLRHNAFRASSIPVGFPSGRAITAVADPAIEIWPYPEHSRETTNAQNLLTAAAAATLFAAIQRRPPSAATPTAAPAPPPSSRWSASGPSASFGSPTAYLAAIGNQRGQLGAFTITYPDGTYVIGTSSCLAIDGTTAYVTGKVALSAVRAATPTTGSAGTTWSSASRTTATVPSSRTS